jgi:aminoglycoside 6'-N-acetyltransferase I
MNFRTAQEADLANWIALRHALWPDHTLDVLSAEARAVLASQSEVCFLAVDDQAGTVGFLEGAVHPGPKGPYGHVEGWYVEPEFRRQGIGRELVGRFELWCLHRAICLLTSDTDAPYTLSPQAHAGCGFRQIAELKIFLKELR